MKTEFGELDFESLFDEIVQEPAEADDLELDLENSDPETGDPLETEEVEEPEEWQVEETEEKEEEEEDELVKEDKPEQTTKTYSEVFPNLAKKYIELGTWQDAEVEIDGEKVVLSEVENLDEETFLQIQVAQEGLKEEGLKDKYIDKTELDEVGLKILEVSKEGGDWNKILQIKQKYIDPLESYDLNNVQHQEALVREKLFLNSGQTLSKHDLDSLIATRKKNLTLDSEASEYANQVKGAFSKYIEEEKTRAITERQEGQKASSELKDKTKKALKSYKLNEAAINPMLELISKGDNEVITGFIEDIKNNPEDLAELVFFLTKREDYKKHIIEKGTLGNSTKVLKTLNMIPKGTQNKSFDTQEKKKSVKDLDKELELRFI